MKPEARRSPEIKTATQADQEELIGLLTLAFSTDPMARWVPGPKQYLENFPVLARAFGGDAFKNGTAFYSEGFGGAAVWLAPGSEPNIDAMIAHVESTTPTDLKADLFAIFEKMEHFHPKEPHWYLPLIGVDPARQNQGIGTALMNHALELCDKDHLPAYLESSNPRNIPLYERHGFKVIGEIQSGTSPVLRPMLREAR